ncbi:hypothetical protein SYNPS1DRAFT_27697 [Syncephalis pseudoplumigaleata]|uniref:F-box domain-containing protein n=1 Tax=Syncephalis pseudoplumigaleata TaxID=1712513 RepID=A0A4P9Z2M6_9FUNG|nr:hypothetical protein SYNPS1DRAFT_27697 [Syncephalis pseudoplumigaleata]|eukprot:RKP26625.1 hypothetical protein SYNPS1DRAFT_27697 [Syncephalis pseudoplumigaleata]
MDRPPISHLEHLERPRFECLPLELRIYHIYALLPVHSLARCRAVSRRWRAVVDEALEKAHPYQRVFALRDGLNPGLASTAVTTATGFPLLSLDAWETAFYGLGVPRQFAHWFRTIRLGGAPARNGSVASRPANSRSSRPAAWRARALLEETEALCFLYRVCYGIAGRRRYAEHQDVQSGICVNYLHLALDMYDRLHEAVASMQAELDEERPSGGEEEEKQAAHSKSHDGSAADDAGSPASVLEWIEVLQLQQQRIFTQILQLPAMSSRFLLGHSAFCFNFLSRLFSAFSMVPTAAARALARLVHGIITLHDGVVTARELDTLLTCLAGKEPLALSLLARHQLLLRYASLVGPDETSACRVDLDELRRLLASASTDTGAPTSEQDKISDATTAEAPLGVVTVSAAQLQDKYSTPPVKDDGDDNKMPSSPTESLSSLASFSLPGSPQMAGAPLSQTTAEQRLIWLFEHVAALAVPSASAPVATAQQWQADAILPFVNEFEMLLNRCTAHAS